MVNEFDLKKLPSHGLCQKDEELIHQIYNNMVSRGIISCDAEDVGINKSELRVLAYNVRLNVYEELSIQFKERFDRYNPDK